MPTRCGVLCTLILLSLAAGCLPSAPTPAPAATPATPPAQTAAQAAQPTEPPASEPVVKRSSLTIDTTGLGGVDVEVATESLENGQGFRVTGSFGLDATITRVAGENWAFAGTLEFPTGGYEVGEPFTIPLTDVRPGKDGVRVIPSDVQVMVQLPVRIPPQGAVVTQAVETKSFSFSFEAPAHSRFIVSMISG